MLNTRSVYALNKLDKTSIVYPSVTGEDTFLRCEDFASMEEFEYWKNWSDDNYHKAEVDGWNDSRCLSFEAQRDATAPSAEDIVLISYITAEQEEKQQQMLEQIRKHLTDTQFRRWWRHCVQKVPVIQIAGDEKVAESSVSESISRAKEKIFQKFIGKPYIDPLFFTHSERRITGVLS